MRKRSKDWENIFIISDLHSIFLDEKAFDVFLQAYSESDCDRLIINGDLLDFPTISEHAQKIEAFNPQVLDGYSVQEEIDFTIDKILKPLHKVKKGKVPITVRLGNHEERFIRPNKANAAALGDLLDTSRRRGSTRLEDLLRLPSFNARLSYNGIDRLYGTFTLVHGVSTNENAPKNNLKKYGSGSSGHSHRANSKIQTFYQGCRGWWESGTLRKCENVEYMPRGEVADWQHGFLTLSIRKSGLFFCQTHLIVDYKCMFNGTLYS